MEPVTGPEPVSINEDAASTIQPVQTAASPHMMMEAIHQERACLDEEIIARITELETELAQVKTNLEAERALRVSEEADRRERERSEDLERHGTVHTQLNNITNLVQEQRDEFARMEELIDERWNEKMNRCVEKDAQIGNLYDMMTRIIEDREAERIRREEERIAAESRPGTSISHHGSVWGLALKLFRD